MVHSWYITHLYTENISRESHLSRYTRIIPTLYTHIIVQGKNRLPRTQFGYPGPKSLFRTRSSVIPDQSPPSAHTVRFYRTPTSNVIRRGFRSPPASRPGSGILPTRLSCLPCRYYTEPMYWPIEGGSTLPTNGTLTMRL